MILNEFINISSFRGCFFFCKLSLFTLRSTQVCWVFLYFPNIRRKFIIESGKPNFRVWLSSLTTWLLKWEYTKKKCTLRSCEQIGWSIEFKNSIWTAFSGTEKYKTLGQIQNVSKVQGMHFLNGESLVDDVYDVSLETKIGSRTFKD